RLGMRDRSRGRRVRLRPLQEDAADRAVRRAEIDVGARLPDLLAAERDDVADERPDDEPEHGQPPARHDRAPPSPEIDFSLFCAQRAATLREAPSQGARKPAPRSLVARQPRSLSIRRVSAAVRRTSPATASLTIRSSVRPEISSSVAIASRIVASVPPPTL